MHYRYYIWKYRRHRRRERKARYLQSHKTPFLRPDPLLPRPRLLSLTSCSLSSAALPLPAADDAHARRLDSETAIAQSPFFALPLELRQHVYEHLFSGWTFTLRTRKLSSANGGSKLIPGLLCPDAVQGERKPNFLLPRMVEHAFQLPPWLLVCRQAYTETITLLYSTNTFSFYLGDNDLFRHPHSYLLPQRLSQITSLELVNDLFTSPNPQYFPYVLSRIPHLFPSLRRCRILLKQGWYPLYPSETMPDRLLPASKGVFPAVDRLVGEMVRVGMRRLEEFNLDVTDYLYALLEMQHTSFSEIDKGKMVVVSEEGVKRPMAANRSFWRRVAVHKDGELVERGYWVSTHLEEISPVIWKECW